MTGRRLVVGLALAALRRDRLQLLCNLAMILGVTVPMLTILGAKNGAVSELLGRLARDPGLLVIETADYAEVTAEQIAAVAAVPGVTFVVPRSRGQSGWVLVTNPDAQAPAIRNAELAPTASADPLLDPLASLEADEVAISADLAERLGLAAGGVVEIVVDAEGRPLRGLARRRVAAVLPTGRLSGQAVLADLAFLDAVEAYRDGYAAPELGVTDGLDRAARAPAHEGLRAHVAAMADVAPARRRIEALLGRNTTSAAAAIEAARRTIGDLDAAFRLVALAGFVGIAAALTGAQVAEVARRRRTLATMTLMGFDRRDLLLMPAVQSAAVVGLGLALSLALFVPAAAAAERILDPDAASAGTFVFLRWADLAAVALGGAAVALLASLVAGRRILAIPPAVILRDSA